MTDIAFNDKGFAEQTGFVTVYSYNNLTGEYLKKYETQVVMGTTIPANSCLKKPPELSEKQCAVWNKPLSCWDIVENYRGSTAYNKETGSPVEVLDLGQLPDTLTLLKPECEYPVWNDSYSIWVTDPQRKRSALQKEADNVIQLLSEERDAGIISDDDLVRWKAWVKYRKALRELDVTATHIEWPTKPE